MDRGYQFARPKTEFLWGVPFTVIVTGINLVIFLILNFAPASLQLPVYQNTVMLVSRVANFNALWTLLTYGFVQFEFTHLLFNMLAFVIFGIQLERYFGSLKYGLFFLVTILGTGIITFFYHFILLEDVILLGASGGVYGVLMGYAVLRPEGRILIWGIIPIRAKFLVLLWAGISVFNIISGSQDNVSHIGHLSGFFVAWLYYLVVFRINPWHSFLGSSNNSSGGYGR